MSPKSPTRRERLRGLLVDLEPVKRDRDFRMIWIGQLVSGMQPLQGVDEDAELHGQRKTGIPTPDDDLRKRLPFQVLHDDDRGAVEIEHLVGLNDVRMIQSGRELGLAEEHGTKLGVAAQVLAQNLEDDELAKSSRSVGNRQVHVGGSALSQVRDNSVLCDGCLSSAPSALNAKHQAAEYRPSGCGEARRWLGEPER